MLRISILAFAISATAATADVWTFETPSENIQCVVGQGFESADLTCTIINRNGAPAAPRPAGCTQDWGHSFTMNDTGPVQMLCEKLNRNKDGYDRAEYGVTGEFAGFTCYSSTKGLDCRNSDGHGFLLSRARQQVY